ncbi:hypothetical protein PIROE2DRAFT_15630 [Piromyces sp. E2]|nr:hypothetical protein PIROE2DRAFT_15630 [Piromyces sp. E2]|eukprot:OUM58969.1 hypothetical protein PIROE2DRAFT_15630 [Piromyces sp. E2]
MTFATKTVEIFNNTPSVNKMVKFRINDKSMRIKRNKTPCSNKGVPGHVYCGSHLRMKGKSPLPNM